MSENDTLTFAAAAQEQSREQRRKRDAKKKGVRGILKCLRYFMKLNALSMAPRILSQNFIMKT
jgi:hypothetical protein